MIIGELLDHYALMLGAGFGAGFLGIGLPGAVAMYMGALTCRIMAKEPAENDSE